MTTHLPSNSMLTCCEYNTYIKRVLIMYVTYMSHSRTLDTVGERLQASIIRELGVSFVSAGLPEASFFCRVSFAVAPSAAAC